VSAFHLSPHYAGRYREGGALGIEQPTVCRYCARSTVGLRGVIEHYDGETGEAWAEHKDCAPAATETSTVARTSAASRRPTRDYLAPAPWRLP
jgi:hypothetical protein